jgi:hypothetical protein
MRLSPAVEVSVQYTVSGVKPVSGCAEKLAEGGPFAVMYWLLISVSLQPCESVTVNVTLYLPLPA